MHTKRWSQNAFSAAWWWQIKHEPWIPSGWLAGAKRLLSAVRSEGSGVADRQRHSQSGAVIWDWVTCYMTPRWPPSDTSSLRMVWAARGRDEGSFWGIGGGEAWRPRMKHNRRHLGFIQADAPPSVWLDFSTIRGSGDTLRLYWLQGTRFNPRSFSQHPDFLCRWRPRPLLRLHARVTSLQIYSPCHLRLLLLCSGALKKSSMTTKRPTRRF